MLEHPEASHAWWWFGMCAPPRFGGWVNANWLGGWTCCVEQGHYGHRARKAIERRFIISLTVIAGAVGAFGAGLTSEAARWLWATFLAVVSSGWATLAAWWNS